MKKGAYDVMGKGPGQAAASALWQAGGDTGRNTSLLCTLGSSFRERSKGREGRIMLEDLKAPYSSHIALFQKHEEEGGGRGAPSPGVP